MGGLGYECRGPEGLGNPGVQGVWYVVSLQGLGIGVWIQVV